MKMSTLKNQSLFDARFRVNPMTWHSIFVVDKASTLFIALPGDYCFLNSTLLPTRYRLSASNHKTCRLGQVCFPSRSCFTTLTPHRCHLGSLPHNHPWPTYTIIV